MGLKIVSTIYPVEGRFDELKAEVDAFLLKLIEGENCETAATSFREEDDNSEPPAYLPSRRDVRRTVSRMETSEGAHQVENGSRRNQESETGRGVNSHTAAMVVFCTFLICVTGIILALIAL